MFAERDVTQRFNDQEDQVRALESDRAERDARAARERADGAMRKLDDV